MLAVEFAWLVDIDQLAKGCRQQGQIPVVHEDILSLVPKLNEGRVDHSNPASYCIFCKFLNQLWIGMTRLAANHTA